MKGGVKANHKHPPSRRGGEGPETPANPPSQGCTRCRAEKTEAPAKATDPKTTPATEPKKSDAPAKTAAPKATPAVEPKKPEAPPSHRS